MTVKVELQLLTATWSFGRFYEDRKRLDELEKFECYSDQNP